MIDLRHIRFASISGIERRDLPVAAEIWLDEIAKSCWATRDIIKISTLISQYIGDPDPERLSFSAIERIYGLDKGQVIDNLRSMMSFGAVVSYDCDGSAMKASHSLSYLQRLRVLEVGRKFSELRANGRNEGLPWHGSEKNWILKCNLNDEGGSVDALADRKRDVTQSKLVEIADSVAGRD